MSSVDHFVGARQELFRNDQTERLCDLEIDDEVELDRLLDRQLGSFRSLENLVYKSRGAAIQVGIVHAVHQQAAGVDELAGQIGRGQPVPRGQIPGTASRRISTRFNSVGRRELFTELAAELVRLNVDLIVTRATPAVLAARSATATIPIVMAASGDPLGTGVVASLARPGGNVTGLSSITTSAERYTMAKFCFSM
jgi:ABC transporter substrate binding protein